jgi:hypothetical protein
MESAGSSKLEAWLTGSEFVLSLKRISISTNGLMLVFQHHKLEQSARDKKYLHEA